MKIRGYKVYCDGSVYPKNPGRGGWAAIIEHDGDRRFISGQSALQETNNRMEITSLIKAVEGLPGGSKVSFYSDSQYLVDGVNERLSRWKAWGWKTSLNSPVKNIDLWKIVDSLTQKYAMRGYWLRGHSGHPENEACDALAYAEASK